MENNNDNDNDNDMTCDSEAYSFGLLFLCIIIGNQHFVLNKKFCIN